MELLLIGLILGLGLYMAWNIGANDVANSMATAVGAKAISLRQATIIAGILEMTGAIFVGSHVTGTISKGIVDPMLIDSAQKVMIGLLASVLAASIWITMATWKEMPISTTHSIVGAVIGFGVVAGGVNVVSWGKVLQVMASWLTSPIIGAIISYLIFRSIVKFIFNSEDQIHRTRIVGPLYVGMTFLLITLSAFLKTNIGSMLFGTDEITPFLVSLAITGLAILAAYFWIKRLEYEGTDIDHVERIFRRLQIITSGYVAFAHGSNDVANAIGPVAAALNIYTTSAVPSVVTVSIYLLVLGGLGIAMGVFTWGYRVMKTIAFKITELTNTRGFSIDIGVATTVLMASRLGMPVSTTHTVVGAVMGVGLARGIEAIDLRVIRGIVVSWLITLPIAALTAIVIYLGITGIMGI